MNAEPVAPSNVARLLLFQILITKIRTLLRIVGFAPTIRLLRAVPRVGETLVAIDDRWAGEIDLVARPPLGGSCLDRAVLMWFVMRQHGIDGEVRIGVRREPSGNGSGDGIVGHAWVEHFGVVVNDDADVADTYAVFDGDIAGLAFE